MASRHTAERSRILRKDVGSATLLDPKKDKWRVSCQRKGVPHPMRRPTIFGIENVNNHLDKVEALLDLYGRSKENILDLVSPDDLTTCNRQLEALNDDSKPCFNFVEIFQKGLEAAKVEMENEHFPALRETIEDYKNYRSSKEGNSRGDWVVHANTLTFESTFLDEISAEFGHLRLDKVFNPRTGFKTESKKYILNKWRSLAPKSRQDRAKALRMVLNFAKANNPSIKYPNPLTGWDGSFQKTTKSTGAKTTLSPDTVRELFDTAANHPLWVQNIPYMALLFFTGSRPYDVASGRNAGRRWRWEWFSEFKNISNISGGYIATLPPWNEDGTKASSKKTQAAQNRDLTPNGFEWIDWFYQEVKQVPLPLTGKIFFSRTYWDKLRKSLNLYGENWNKDISRRNFSTYAHAKWSNDIEYWCEACGHNIKTFRNHYKGKRSAKEADEFFRISPKIHQLPDSQSDEEEFMLADMFEEPCKIETAL
jgi:hypothetical protein